MIILIMSLFPASSNSVSKLSAQLVGNNESPCGLLGVEISQAGRIRN